MRKLYIKIIIFLLFFGTFGKIVAQQDPQFSHYLFNQFYLNPAMAGAENVTRFQAIYRTQYTGYQPTNDDGTPPTTQLISANVPLKFINSGVGIYYVNDKIGNAFGTQAALSYGYHLPVGNGQLGIGVRAGLYTRGINYDNLRYKDSNDPLIPTGKISQSQPDLGLGLYYDASSFNVGLSVNHINQPNFSIGTKDAKNTLNRQAYLTASTLIGLTYQIDLTPMFLLKTDMKTFSPEMGAIATYNSKFYFGGSYRLGDAATGLAGVNLLNNSLRIGYAFDFIIAGVSAKSNTSHEILLSYTLAPFRAGKKSIIRTPRYRY